MDPIQSMPGLEAMVKNKYGGPEWLMYYRNIWMRHLTARTVDVMSDTISKAKNADELVQAEDGRSVPVKERLELRKIGVSEALEFVAAIDALLAIPAEEFTAKMWSPEALAVAPDMLEEKKAEEAPQVGQPCTTEDGKAGTWMPGAEGQPPVCMPTAEKPQETAAAGV